MGETMWLLKDSDGVTAIEYGIISLLIILACVASLGVVGGNLSGVFQGISAVLPG